MDRLPAGPGGERVRMGVLGFDEIGKSRRIGAQSPDQKLPESVFWNRKGAESPVESLQEVPRVGKGLEGPEVGKNPLKRGLLRAHKGSKGKYELGCGRFDGRGSREETGKGGGASESGECRGWDWRVQTFWGGVLEVQNQGLVGLVKRGFIKRGLAQRVEVKGGAS